MNFETLASIGAEEQARQAQLKRRIFCCTSTACLSAGARATHKSLVQAIAAVGEPENTSEIVATGCMGLCSKGPLVRVEEQETAPILYGGVDTEIAHQIIDYHVGVSNALAESSSETQGQMLSAHDIPHFRASTQKARQKKGLKQQIIPLDMPFFTKQVKVVLQQVGRIAPDKIEDYLAHGGYTALADVLKSQQPKDVCEVILQSGLRGRGGAGFPTGIKWNFVREADAVQKFVIVNGDEGDPGAYMDRTVMEDDPHRVLEGMIICAYAVGATKGYFYIRGEYPIAIRRIRGAIEAAKAHQILGESVLGTNFSFEAHIRIGAGAFVCGEETALIHSIEGQRGTPRLRPPYPSQAGLWGMPTVINNVETIASVPSIIKNGPDWYASIGTEKSKGTKVFALAGHLRHTGLIEVPMGIALNEIVNEIGGGVPGNHSFKAAQTGGPSGGCIPLTHMGTPVDYENLKELGSIMGSGGLVIIDDSTSMPEFSRFFMDFCVDESCGKCVPCRIGTVQIRWLLDKLIAGEGSEEDLEKLEDLCQYVKSASMCGLGQSAPNPVLSTLKYFRHEYEMLLKTNKSNDQEVSGD